VRHSKP